MPRTDPMDVIARHAVAMCPTADVAATERVLRRLMSDQAEQMRDELRALDAGGRTEAAQIVAVLSSLLHELARY